MIALVTTANTVDEWRIVTNQLIVRSDDTVGAYAQANVSYNQANIAYNQANVARTQANDAYSRANTAYTQATDSYGRANTANNTPVGNTTSGDFTVRSTRNRLNFKDGSNILIQVEDYATGDAANIIISSTAVASGNAVLAYDQANTARDHANAAFTKANVANNIAVGNTLTGTFTQRSARERLNFIPGTNIIVNVDDDAVGNRVNVTITSTAADGAVAGFAALQSNTARDQANVAFTTANVAWAQANTGTTQATTARDTANIAYVQANTARTQANDAYSRANTAQVTGESAFAKANAALPNTTTTLAGTLTVTQNVTAGNVRTLAAYIFPNGNAITNYTVSTSSPTGGANGDIWLKIV